jgi:hypothetical protein
MGQLSVDEALDEIYEMMWYLSKVEKNAQRLQTLSYLLYTTDSEKQKSLEEVRDCVKAILERVDRIWCALEALRRAVRGG